MSIIIIIIIIIIIMLIILTGDLTVGAPIVVGAGAVVTGAVATDNGVTRPAILTQLAGTLVCNRQ